MPDVVHRQSDRREISEPAEFLGAGQGLIERGAFELSMQLQQINSHNLVIADRWHCNGEPRSRLLGRNVSSRHKKANLTGFGSRRQLDDDPLLTNGDQFSEWALHHHRVREVDQVHRH